MTEEDIIRMAQEAKDGDSDDPDTEAIDWVIFTPFELQRFTTLVAQQERNACADLCEKFAGDMTVLAEWGASQCANAIRARAQA